MPPAHSRKRSTKAAPAPPADAPGADRYPLDVVITLGVPQTGKSAGVKALVMAERRLVVWDANDEWRRQRCQRIESLAALRDAMLAAGAGPSRLAFVPLTARDFIPFCALVRAWAEPERRDRAPCCVVVEELADVVPPGRAPREWGMLTRGGRHRGLKVRAVGHSPKEIDKTALKFASTWRVHQLGGVTDSEYMAREILGVDPEPLIKLQPFEFLEIANKYPRILTLRKTAPI